MVDTMRLTPWCASDHYEARRSTWSTALFIQVSKISFSINLKKSVFSLLFVRLLWNVVLLPENIWRHAHHHHNPHDALLLPVLAEHIWRAPAVGQRPSRQRKLVFLYFQ